MAKVIKDSDGIEEHEVFARFFVAAKKVTKSSHYDAAIMAGKLTEEYMVRKYMNGAA